MKLLKYILLCACIYLVSCSRQQNVLPSLNETFKKEDKSPFGTYVAYQQFKKIFDNRYIEVTDRSFDELWTDMKEYSLNTKYSLYMLIAKNLVLNDDEINSMLQFVKGGNDMFISSDYFDNEFLNKINCKVDRYDEIVNEVGGIMQETSVSMSNTNLFVPGKYKYYYFPFLNSLYSYDTVSARVLALNESDYPNYIVMFIGKGRLYLHAAPRAFSNYFLLTGNNFQYVENVLSYLRPEPKNIFWDEYYKSRSLNKRNNGSGKNNKDNNFSSLKVINKNPPLFWAFWLAIAAIILYVIFNLKRKQRIINELKPNPNTTLVFAETVGRLYLQKKNNKNITDKIVTYFFEYIRNKYFMNTAEMNEKFIITLSGKSGVELNVTRELFTQINILHAKEYISDEELVSLNDQIQNFYKVKTDGRKLV